MLIELLYLLRFFIIIAEYHLLWIYCCLAVYVPRSVIADLPTQNRLGKHQKRVLSTNPLTVLFWFTHSFVLPSFSDRSQHLRQELRTGLVV